MWAPTELKAFKVLPVSAHLLREDGARLGLKERRQRDMFWFTTWPEGEEAEGHVLVHYLA